jgi:hypothetical protein
MRSHRITRYIKLRTKPGLVSRLGSQQRLKLNLNRLKRRIRLVPADDPAALVILAPRRKRLRLSLHWQVWAAITTGLTLGVGALAAVALLRTPMAPRCDRVFWPLASASLRLHCAQVQASQLTLEGLLDAIRLVEQLPANHPLRPEINRLVELWSREIFELAEDAYQEGKLERAVQFADQIPKTTKVWLQVPPQVKRWQQTWNQAEAIDRQVETLLRQLNWRQAFWEAVRLTLLDNRYWRNVRFEVLSQRIMQAQEDETQLTKARSLAQNGDLESLLQALKLTQGIEGGSYFRQAAQEAIAGISQQMLDLASSLLDNQDLQGALAAAQAIPETVPLWKQAQDFVLLAYAESWTWSDTVMGLEEAVARARTLAKDRPLHGKAQELISRWQLEREALILLNQAQELASGGGVNQLNAAIAKAAAVNPSNPRWPEVQRQMAQWQRQIDIIQDQPVLDRAEQLAWSGSANDLQAAIAAASQIGSGRALYGEAQARIQDWQNQLQLLNNRQIARQQFVETDSQAQQLLQEAKRMANGGSFQALAAAIEKVNQVSEVSVSRGEADLAIDQWSQAILELARRRAESDPTTAIAIAQQVPSFAGAYAEAQYWIREWQTQGQPNNP